MTRYDRRSIGLAIALSSLAGYVDAIGFLSTGNFFVSFMSGNSTRLAVGVGQHRYGYALLALGVIALFVLGVVGGTLVSFRAGPRRKPAVLAFVAGLLAVAAAAHALRFPDWGTAFLLLAMGAENAVFQSDGEVTIGVTYMTGALVKMGQRIAAIAQGGSPTAWVPYALLWLGLVVGAVFGSLVHVSVGPAGLWIAALAAVGLAVFSMGIRLPETRSR